MTTKNEKKNDVIQADFSLMAKKVALRQPNNWDKMVIVLRLLKRKLVTRKNPQEPSLL